MTAGGGWFCGGAEAVRRDRGEVEVHPPEEHACGQSEDSVIFMLEAVHWSKYSNLPYSFDS